MASATTSAPIACTGAPLQAVETDFLAVPWFEGEGPSAVGILDGATGGEIARALASKEFTGRLYELFVTPVNDRGWRTRRVALIGAGPKSEFNSDLVRKIAAAAGLQARQRRMDRVAFVLRGDADIVESAQAAAEGLTLSEFNAGSYKTTEPAPSKPSSWIVVVPSSDSVSRVNSAIARGRILGECSNLARDMANEPGNALTPREFARRCQNVVADANVSFEALDEHQIEKLGMGLLLGVARGSSEPPREDGSFSPTGCGTRASWARRIWSTSRHSPAPAWSRWGRLPAVCSVRRRRGSIRCGASPTASAIGRGRCRSSMSTASSSRVRS